MKKKMKKIVNSLIAVIASLFIVIVTVPVVSYASSHDEEWWSDAAYIDDGFQSRLIGDDIPDYFSEIGNDAIIWGSKDSTIDPEDFYDSVVCADIGNNYGTIRCGAKSDSEIVACVGAFQDNHGYSFKYVSRSVIRYEGVGWYADTLAENLNGSNYKISSWGYVDTPFTSNDYTGYFYDTGSVYRGYYSNMKFYSLDVKVFDSLDHALQYLYTGDETGLLYSPAPPVSYDSGLYLENFKMTVHDSNVYSKYYLSFSYTIPDTVLQNYDINDLQLRIDNYCQWECTETYKYGAGGLNSSKDNLLSTESSQIDYISLSHNRSGFILYLDDLSSVYELIYNNGKINASSDTSKRYLLGNGSSFSIDGFDISSDTIGVSYDNGLIEVTKSRLSLNIFLEYNGSVMGHEYNGSVDFLNGDNSYMESYTPDASGNYNYNDDYKYSDGYYYTDVGTDSAGNPTYNYYYYDSSGGRSPVDSSGQPIVIDNSTGNITQTVNVPDTINVNLHNTDSSGSGGGITIEDDDFSFSSISSILKSGFGLIDDVDTDVKGDGYVDSMKYLYGYLPEDFSNLPVFGICSVVAIAIIRALLKR